MNIESFNTTRYQLDIELNDRLGAIKLRDKYSNVEFADSEYRYSVYVEHKGVIKCLEGLLDPKVDEVMPERGGSLVTITGKMGDQSGLPLLCLKHRFYIPEDSAYLEEVITLQNLTDSEIFLRSYRFAFRKKLEKPKAYGGPGIDIENYRLIAVPFRLQPDGKKHDYMIDDIYYGRFLCSEAENISAAEGLVDRGRGRSEGWVWTDGENGLLIIKYNTDSIEYSMLETERQAGNVFLNFGGASPSLYGEPREARNLNPGKQVSFGMTRMEFYEGLWRQGSYMFRDYMSGIGHGLPDNYNPKVYWSACNELPATDNSPGHSLYNEENFKKEAEKACDLGCEQLFFETGWETCPGSTIWDDSRLGNMKDFVEDIKSNYGLGTGIKIIGRSYCDDFPGSYRRRFDHRTGYAAPYSARPFYEPCFVSRQYQENKNKRIRDILAAGVEFAMFDEFDWRGPCFDEGHGHDVPTLPSEHARAVVELAEQAKVSNPNLSVEVHDPIWPWSVRYLPIYYLHDSRKDSQNFIDETWAFDFGKNALDELLSGKALSLFYYNLAYDIPLHVQLNIDSDNDNCLAFWWFASTVRHIGLSGRINNPQRWLAYKNALSEYMNLKELYVRGEFYGVDELVHIHALPEHGAAVVNAYNLTDSPITREAQIRLSDLGFLEEVSVEGAPCSIKGSKLILQLSIPAYSPIIIKLNSIGI